MNYVSEQNIDNIVKGLSNKIAMSVSNGALIGDTTPVGTVISFMGTQAPLFYLVCDGTTYNIVDYVELANFIEAQFGSKNYFGGNGTTTFAVPDLQGEFLRGSGTNSHTNQGNGSNVGTHQDGTEFPNICTWNNNLYKLRKSGETSESIYKADSSLGSRNDAIKVAMTVESTSGSDATTFTSRPTNTSVLYCIKYTKAVIPSEYEDGTPVGRVIFDCILREGYIKANGAQIEDATIAIPRLLSFVQKYSSQILAPDQATYEANVGLYMYDSNNDILTLPNYIGRFMEGGNSVESVEAGLPNIKGSVFGYRMFDKEASEDTVHYNNGACSGALKGRDGVDTSKVLSQSSDSNKNITNGIDFDASQSNSIYSDSVSTVQPPSIKLIPQIRY